MVRLLPLLVVPLFLLTVGCDNSTEGLSCNDSSECVCSDGLFPVCSGDPGTCSCISPDAGTPDPDAGTDGGTDGSTDAEEVIEEIVGEDLDLSRDVFTVTVDIATGNSNPALSLRVPVDYIDSEEIGFVAMTLDQPALDRIASLPSLGALVFDAQPGTTRQPGDYLFAWQKLQASIPQMSSTELYQYAFVADRDGQAGNNYSGQAPFENDYFNDTDIWFDLGYDLQGGWSFQVLNALDGVIMPRASGAVSIIADDINMFIVPTLEFGGSTTIAARWTSFAHEGDFGQQGGPWSGDTWPEVGAALRQLSLDPVER